MAGNFLPILLLGGAAAYMVKKKKKKSEHVQEHPEAPEEPPFLPGESGGSDPGLESGARAEPEPGKAVANGVERHHTGAYTWKILYTTEGDYAAHYYPMGHMGPHEEVARSGTVEEAIQAFQLWATNEDRRKRNLPPILIAKAIDAEPAQAGYSDISGD